MVVFLPSDGFEVGLDKADERGCLIRSLSGKGTDQGDCLDWIQQGKEDYRWPHESHVSGLERSEC